MRNKEMIKQILELKEKLEYATSRFEILNEIEKLRNYYYYGTREGLKKSLWEEFIKNTRDGFEFVKIIEEPLSFNNTQLEYVLREYLKIFQNKL